MARVYDFWLGGRDNFAADRAVAERVAAAYPDIRIAVRAQRAFLARAVHFLVTEAGIRQFLDIGTGLPSANNTHQVAQAAAPESRVVYVDDDPIVLNHARALLTSSPGATAYIDADLRDTGPILERAAPRPRLRAAGRGHAAGNPAGHTRSGAAGRDHRPPHGRVPIGQRLALTQIAGERRRRRGAAGVQRYNEQAAARSPRAPTPRRAGFSRVWTWLSPAWCRSTGGGRAPETSAAAATSPSTPGSGGNPQPPGSICPAEARFPGRRCFFRGDTRGEMGEPPSVRTNGFDSCDW